MKLLCKLMFFIIAISIQSSSNTVPSAIWPQNDVKDREISKKGATIKILISAASSNFKDAVINDLTDSLKSDSVFIKVTGLKKISSVKPENWNLIVIINTCMAWQMDNRVQNFIKTYPSYRGFIILTTSGNPDSCGSRNNISSYVDAISSASLTNVKEKVVNQVLAAIREHVLHKR